MRYYSKSAPEVGDLLIVKILKLSDDKGFYAESFEYPDFRIYILPTEIARKPQNLRTFLPVGKICAVVILSISKKKKIIDVSYKNVSVKDGEDRVKRFYIYQKIHKFGTEMASQYSDYLEDPEIDTTAIIYSHVIWPILDDFSEKYDDHTFVSLSEYYTNILENPKLLFCKNETKMTGQGDKDTDKDTDKYADKDNDDIQEDKNDKDGQDDKGDLSNDKISLPVEFIDLFVQNLKSRIKISDIEMFSDIELFVMERDAVTKLKLILTQKISSEARIEYIASPKYRIVSSSENKEVLENVINEAIKQIKINCETYGGSFKSSTPITILRDKQYVVSDYNLKKISKSTPSLDIDSI